MADTTLALALAADDVLMSVAAALSATREGDILCQIDSEFVLVERRGMLTNPQICRGMLGSTRAAHLSGADVTIVLPQVQTTAPASPQPVDVHGVAAGYKIARGVAAVTGTLVVVTGLATVVAIIATAVTDPDGVALAMVSATIGDQAGAPAAGSVILKAWKVTATGNATLIAATAAASLNWLAVGV